MAAEPRKTKISSVLLPVLLVVLIVAVGFYVWQSRHTTADTSVQQSATSSTAKPKTAKVLYVTPAATVYNADELATAPDQHAVVEAARQRCASISQGPKKVAASSVVIATTSPTFFTDAQTYAADKSFARLQAACAVIPVKAAPTFTQNFLVAKSKSDWKVIFMGATNPLCVTVEASKVPAAVVPLCFDGTTDRAPHL